MATNPFRKIVTPEVEAAAAKAGERKPIQRALRIDTRSERSDALSLPLIPPADVQNASKTLSIPATCSIPATWTEVIQNPTVWAEIRPLLVEED